MTGSVSKQQIPVNGQDRRWIKGKEAVWWSVSGNATLPRIGPLVLHLVLMSQPNVMGDLKERVAHGMCAMAYPPGFLVIPMRSAAVHPFSTTNLLVFDPPRENTAGKVHEMYLAKDAVGVPPVSAMDRSQSNNGVLTEVNGDCLVVDPGAMPGIAQQQLATIINALEGQLLVFLTHHHRDHVEGLSIIEQHKPEALVLGHKETLRRIGNVGRKLVKHCVGRGTSITIRNETLLVVPAAGHTIGHLALFHVPTRILVAGDHCTGEGTILLDDRSGGDMEDYGNTTIMFMDLQARVLIPMHGQPSFCPGVMLRMYRKHPIDRESRILSAIRRGANTVYTIVADAYADTPVPRWPSAGRNVLLHVKLLHKKERLPEASERAVKVCLYFDVCILVNFWLS
ncbi:hypothetical protein CBR_g162 [Chara braunii]|uniref:Metallo-beta-lactamase domain-containing protein n=1 Tax=Chara braunii TaxID=69332 RepID=A0A388JM20_CHABU|nr:hypothetical protein CBR_g162 [Chara braunii]|eukprot:GBG58762.1 hypothetical protein CBR_g162 [Chara braunii]